MILEGPVCQPKADGWSHKAEGGRGVERGRVPSAGEF